MDATDSLLAAKIAHSLILKSEREPEVKLPFKLEPVRPQELP